jgi:Tfp pilus assembly protein PilF
LIDEAKIAGRDSDVRDLSDEATKNFAEAQSLYQQSENEFQIALELNPEYTEAHNNLGFILSRQGRYKEAEAQFREALYYTPDFESAQLNLKRIQQLEANPKP